MNVHLAQFEFKWGTFVFIPIFKEELSGRVYTVWHILIFRKLQVYQTFYRAFVPSACICRRIKKNLNYELVW